jgi:hypothetical protein
MWEEVVKGMKSEKQSVQITGRRSVRARSRRLISSPIYILLQVPFLLVTPHLWGALTGHSSLFLSCSFFFRSRALSFVGVLESSSLKFVRILGEQTVR